MSPVVERLRCVGLVLTVGCGLAVMNPCRAHEGPPYPIVMDRAVGPYIVSVWADPDIGTGTFFVVFEPPRQGSLPPVEHVQVGVQPLTETPAEIVIEAKPQEVRNGMRYWAEVPFAHGGDWRVRVLIEAAAGGGEILAQVEATPDGVIGPIGLLVYLVPFLSVGFLWWKAARRRRLVSNPTT
jgi:hypothetical protein